MESDNSKVANHDEIEATLHGMRYFWLLKMGLDDPEFI